MIVLHGDALNAEVTLKSLPYLYFPTAAGVLT